MPNHSSTWCRTVPSFARVIALRNIAATYSRARIWATGLSPRTALAIA